MVNTDITAIVALKTSTIISQAPLRDTTDAHGSAATAVDVIPTNVKATIKSIIKGFVFRLNICLIFHLPHRYNISLSIYTLLLCEKSLIVDIII